MAPKKINHNGDGDNSDKRKKGSKKRTPKHTKTEAAKRERSHKGKKLNLWPEENMPKALEQYKHQKAGTWRGKTLSVRGLAKKYKIPNSTLL